MQLAVDVSFNTILSLISKMNISEIEQVKDEIIEKELYFQKFKKEPISEIVESFDDEGYSKDFLQDLENGLKKSSVYNED